MNLTQMLPTAAKRRIIYSTFAILFMIGVGTFAFHLLEDLSFVDSLYLAAQTVTTVGFGDIAPRTTSGRIFAVAFMLFGVGTVLYSLSAIAQLVIQSELVSVFGLRRNSKKMEKLNNHYIICGAGRVGRRIIRSLQSANKPFVVIERDEHQIEKYNDEEFPLIIGDATNEELLLRAGVDRAKGLATCLPDDAANVYVVLTARGLNKNLHIVARAVEEQAEPKLIRAGASRVVSPTIIGSQSISRALLKPAIADFMESIVAENLDLVFEEVLIGAHSIYAAKPLRETNISTELNTIVVAVRHADGTMLFHPNGETIINDGDLLIVVGKAETVKKLKELSKI